MSLALVGLSFRTAPVAVRERLTLTHAALGAALTAESGAAGEIAILSTCNRFEVYTADAASDPTEALARAHAFIAREGRAEADALAPHLYALTGADAARHLFTVAAGLDSLVLGEAQILGQVGDALQLALACGTAGRHLAALLRHAITAGRRVRSETGLGQGSGSVSHAAVALARRTLGDLRDRRVLLIGAGKMAEIAAHVLAESAVGAVRVLNRDPDRAAAVAAAIGGTACDWAHLPDALAWADVVITSTGAPHTLIHAQTVAAIWPQRAERPLLIIDLAVPRDVDPAVGDLAGVTLADIDALHGTIDAGMRDRAAHIPQARAIITEETARFMRRYEERDAAPTIAELRDHAERIRTGEVQRAMRRLATLDPDAQRAVEALTTAIINKLLHEPTVELKRHASDPRFTQAARTLFGLTNE
jgi:glutamyl-tRNA reductase